MTWKTWKIQGILFCQSCGNPVKSKKDSEKSSEKYGKQDAGQQGKGATDVGNKDFCLDCSKRVLDNQQGIQCDSCGNLYHFLCHDIPDVIPEFLRDHTDVPSLQWCCKK